MPLVISISNTVSSDGVLEGGARSVTPPSGDFFIELEDGTGFIALETALTDLLLQEAAP